MQNDEITPAQVERLIEELRVIKAYLVIAEMREKPALGTVETPEYVKKVTTYDITIDDNDALTDFASD